MYVLLNGRLWPMLDKLLSFVRSLLCEKQHDTARASKLEGLILRCDLWKVLDMIVVCNGLDVDMGTWLEF